MNDALNNILTGDQSSSLCCNELALWVHRWFVSRELLAYITLSSAKSMQWGVFRVSYNSLSTYIWGTSLLSTSCVLNFQGIHYNSEHTHATHKVGALVLKAFSVWVLLTGEAGRVSFHNISEEWRDYYIIGFGIHDKEMPRKQLGSSVPQWIEWRTNPDKNFQKQFSCSLQNQEDISK